jgi:hypothetical protein
MHRYSEVEMKDMLEFHIDNIFVIVGGHWSDLLTAVETPMGTNCVLLLMDLFYVHTRRDLLLFKTF